VPTCASQLFLSKMAVAPCHQTNNPATYRRHASQRIRQVSGSAAISGLKGGLFQAEVSPQLAGYATSAAPS